MYPHRQGYTQVTQVAKIHVLVVPEALGVEFALRHARNRRFAGLVGHADAAACVANVVRAVLCVDRHVFGQRHGLTEDGRAAGTCLGGALWYLSVVLAGAQQVPVRRSERADRLLGDLVTKLGGVV